MPRASSQEALENGGGANGVKRDSEAGPEEAAHGASLSTSHGTSTITDSHPQTPRQGYGQPRLALRMPSILDSLSDVRVVQVACGSSHAVALTAQGKLLVWGRGPHGQLGLGSAVTEQAVPREVTEMDGVHIASIAAGGHHTAMLTRSHALYTCGMGTHGQLGHGDFASCSVPTRVASLEDVQVSRVSCGSLHTVLQTYGGDVYVFGCNEQSQLGYVDSSQFGSALNTVSTSTSPASRVEISETDSDIDPSSQSTSKEETKSPRRFDREESKYPSNWAVPTRLAFFEENAIPVRSVSSGSFHTVVLSSDGLVYVFGSGDHGALGLGLGVSVASKPTLIESLLYSIPTISRCYAGNDFSTYITDTGELYVSGRLPFGPADKTWTPKKFVGFSNDVCVHSAAFGANHSLALVDTGELWRNRNIGRLVMCVRNYIHQLRLVATEITPVCETVVGADIWASIIEGQTEIMQGHEQLLFKLDALLENPTNSNYPIGALVLEMLNDSSLLELYTTYASNLSKGVEKYLGCLKSLPNLGSFIEACFVRPLFLAIPGLRQRGSEQFVYFLQLPTTHFADLALMLEDLVKFTPESLSDHADLVRAEALCRQTDSLLKGSVSGNSEYLGLLNFVKKFPDTKQTILAAHRRFLLKWSYAATEGGKFEGTAYLFNDILMLTTVKHEVEHELTLGSTFVQDVHSSRGRQSLILISPLQSHRLFLKSSKKLQKVVAQLDAAITEWLGASASNREQRSLVGIKMLSTQLEMIMPLLSKSYRNRGDSTSPRTPSSELGPSGLLQVSGLPSLLGSLSEIVARSATSLEMDQLRRDRSPIWGSLASIVAPPTLSNMASRSGLFTSGVMPLIEPFLLYIEVPGALKEKKFSSFSKAFTSKRRKRAAEIVSTSVGATQVGSLQSTGPGTLVGGWAHGTSTVSHEDDVMPALPKRYRLAIRVPGHVTVGEAKEMLYKSAAASPWAESMNLKPVREYVLRVRGINYYLPTEHLPLMSLPIIQSIITATRSTPLLELIALPKSGDSNASTLGLPTLPNIKIKDNSAAANSSESRHFFLGSQFAAHPAIEHELSLFEDVCALVGQNRPLSTNNAEIHSFRHSIAGLRIQLRQEKRDMMAEWVKLATSVHASNAAANAASTSSSPYGATNAVFNPNLAALHALEAGLNVGSASSWPQYKGLEALPSKLPTRLTLQIYLPQINNEIHTLHVPPDVTIDFIQNSIFRYIYKHEKHKTREKIAKFVKRILEDSDDDSSNSSLKSDSEDVEYADANQFPVTSGSKADIFQLQPSASKTDLAPISSARSNSSGALPIQGEPDSAAPADGSTSPPAGSLTHQNSALNVASPVTELPPDSKKRKKFDRLMRGSWKADSEDTTNTDGKASPVGSIVDESALAAPTTDDGIRGKVARSNPVLIPTSPPTPVLSPKNKEDKKEKEREKEEKKEKDREEKREKEERKEKEKEEKKKEKEKEKEEHKKDKEEHKKDKESKDKEKDPKEKETMPHQSLPSLGSGEGEDSPRTTRRKASKAPPREKDPAVDRSTSQLPNVSASNATIPEVVEDGRESQNASISASNPLKDSKDNNKEGANYLPPTGPAMVAASSSNAIAVSTSQAESSAGLTDADDDGMDEPTESSLPYMPSSKLSKKEDERLKKLRKEMSKRQKKEFERRRKEAKKAAKESVKKAKKEGVRARKEEKKMQKHLHNGKGIDDFVLKVNGANEFLMPGFTDDRQSVLCDYDYIRRAISHQYPIQLRFIDKTALKKMRTIDYTAEEVSAERSLDLAIARFPPPLTRRAVINILAKHQEMPVVTPRTIHKRKEKEKEGKEKEKPHEPPKFTDEHLDDASTSSSDDSSALGTKKPISSATATSSAAPASMVKSSSTTLPRSSSNILKSQAAAAPAAVTIAASPAKTTLSKLELPNDTETIEVYVGDYVDKPLAQERPFWALKDESTSFRIRLLDAENVTMDGAPFRLNLFVRARLSYGKSAFAVHMISSILPYELAPIWNEDLVWPLRVCDLPREAKITIVLFARADTSNTKPKRLSSDVPLGWVNVMLFNETGALKAGLHGVRLWPQGTKPDRVAGTTTENQLTLSAPGASTLPISLHFEVCAPPSASSALSGFGTMNSSHLLAQLTDRTSGSGGQHLTMIDDVGMGSPGSSSANLALSTLFNSEHGHTQSQPGTLRKRRRPSSNSAAATANHIFAGTSTSPTSTATANLSTPSPPGSTQAPHFAFTFSPPPKENIKSTASSPTVSDESPIATASTATPSAMSQHSSAPGSGSNDHHKSKSSAPPNLATIVPVPIKDLKATITDQDKATLTNVAARDMLTEVTMEEGVLLLKYRHYLRLYKPEALPKLLLFVDWSERHLVKSIHEDLNMWPPIPPYVALQLLDPRFPDSMVRTYAVNRCLWPMSDNDVYRILLQLIQALKYESYHTSSLALFLLRRAFWDPNRIGHFLFWQLKSEMINPMFSERFSVMMEALVKSSGRLAREEFLAQNKVLTWLHQIALEIKGRRGSVAAKTTKLQERITRAEWPDRFNYPLDPRIECTGFEVSSCRVLGSKTVPLLVTFKTEEPLAEPLQLIYKIGDDLRQDALTLQMISLMDDLWKKEGLDLRLKPYHCMALGPDCGIIEVVKNASTTSNINIELGGLRAVLSHTTLLKWLKKHNPTEKLLNRAIENFIYSCAGYSVITFVLGFADRHNDNIMLSRQGHLFHIDFGHFLGHYRKVLGKYVDKADFVFIDQYEGVMGKENFPRFEALCCQAYGVIRKYSSQFITLFALMLASALPELQTEADVLFIKERLQLDLTDEQAEAFFKRKLADSRDNSTIQLNHTFHVVYQGILS